VTEITTFIHLFSPLLGRTVSNVISLQTDFPFQFSFAHLTDLFPHRVLQNPQFYFVHVTKNAGDLRAACSLQPMGKLYKSDQ